MQLNTDNTRQSQSRPRIGHYHNTNTTVDPMTPICFKLGS